MGCQKPPNPSKSNITGAPIPICPYQPPGSALRCVQPISATRGLSCAHLPKSARPSRPIYPHHPPLGALGFIYPNLPPGALGGLSIQIGHQGASGASVPEWATRGFSGAYLPKVATRGALGYIYPNQPPGGAPGPIYQNWPPRALRGLSTQLGYEGALLGLYTQISPNQPLGCAPGPIPKSATRPPGLITQITHKGHQGSICPILPPGGALKQDLKGTG